MHDLREPNSATTNRLLRALPEVERAVFAPKLEPVELDVRQVLQEPGRPIGHLVFPHSGVASVVSEMEDGGIVEIGTIGREGVVGIPLLLNARQMAQRVMVQIPGHGGRIAAAAFARVRAECPELNRLLLRYTLSFITQVAQGSACNRMHPVEARAARWLLMTRDRVDSDSFPLTQEFLAQMLGVTRPSVSIAAGMLQKAGLISYTRGAITILDRPGLEAAACECYGIIAQEFERAIEARE